MDNKLKIPLFWLLIAVGYIVSTLFHLFGLFYGLEADHIATDVSEVPLDAHLSNTVFFTITLLMVFLSAILRSKTFLRVSLVWGALIFLGNVHQIYETLYPAFDLEQFILALLILAVNAALILELWRGLRKTSSIKTDL